LETVNLSLDREVGWVWACPSCSNIRPRRNLETNPGPTYAPCDHLGLNNPTAIFSSHPLLRERSALPNQHLCISDTSVRCPRLRPVNLLIRSPRQYLRSLGKQLNHYPSPNSRAHHIRRTSPWFSTQYPPPPLRNRHTSHKVYELGSPFPSTPFHSNVGAIIYRTSACTRRVAAALSLRR